MNATLASPISQTSDMTLYILERLPDIPLDKVGCPRRAKLEIDLLLLAIESLELGGAEQVLEMAKEIGLDSVIKNRLSLWRMRSTNPLRRAHSRRVLSVNEAKALTIVACQLSRRYTVTIRQLLTEQQMLSSKSLPPECNFRLSEYLDLFRSHFHSRMNPRRSMVVTYADNDKLNELAIDLLNKLLFCTGTAGMKRFWVSLFDGELK
jgi:Protein of unknown function (DUF3038)